MNIIGFDFYGTNVFKSPSSPVQESSVIKISNAIYDEIHIRERTDIDTSSIKEQWQVDTRMRALFENSLEAGNITNSDLIIEQFAIKRRRIDEINDVTLAYRDFENDKQFEYIDYTQSNDEFIYSIVPVSEQMEGLPNSVQIESDFTGWFIVDKFTDDVVAFDKSVGSIEEVQTELVQGRTEIQTMTRFPNIFYDSTDFHRLSLSTVIIPSEWERSGKNYESFVNKFIRTHKPFIVKGGSGEIYVCDISNPSKSAPKNTWKGYDYLTLTIDAVEVEDYHEFMKNVEEWGG